MEGITHALWVDEIAFGQIDFGEHEDSSFTLRVHGTHDFRYVASLCVNGAVWVQREETSNMESIENLLIQTLNLITHRDSRYYIIDLCS